MMAYEKHPEWFENVLNATGKLENLPKAKLVGILETLLTSVPQARDFIESELADFGQREVIYSQKIEEAFRSCSIINGSPEHLYQQLDALFERARQFFEDKEYHSCLRICHGIVEGCLALDDDRGSTEVFPPGFVSEVWELYLKALRKAVLSRTEKNAVKEQLVALSRFENDLCDQEGVYRDMEPKDPPDPDDPMQDLHRRLSAMEEECVRLRRENERLRKRLGLPEKTIESEIAGTRVPIDINPLPAVDSHSSAAEKISLLSLLLEYLQEPPIQDQRTIPGFESI